MKPEDFLEIVGIIALRKAEFYDWIIVMNNNISEFEKEKLKLKISRMDNFLFLSNEEISKKEIEPNKDLKTLGLNLDKLKNILNDY